MTGLQGASLEEEITGGFCVHARGSSLVFLLLMVT